MGDAVQSGNLGGFRFGQDVHGVVHANLETSRMLVVTATEAWRLGHRDSEGRYGCHGHSRGHRHGDGHAAWERLPNESQVV